MDKRIQVSKDNALFTNKRNQVMFIIKSEKQEKQYLKFWVESKWCKLVYNQFILFIPDDWEYLHIVSDKQEQDKENDNIVKISGLILKELINKYNQK